MIPYLYGRKKTIPCAMRDGYRLVRLAGWLAGWLISCERKILLAGWLADFA